MASGGTLEAVDRLLERLAAPWWLGIGGIAAVALAGSTVWWVGAADIAAMVGAGLSAIGGGAAAWRRRQLDHLPLELATRAAVWEGVLGPQVTVRGWLGRGRRIEDLEITAVMDDAPLEVLAHRGPAVGRFQAVVRGLPDWHAARELRIVVRARAEGRDWTVERVYAPGQRTVGRFAPGLRARGGVRFEPETWDRMA